MAQQTIDPTGAPRERDMIDPAHTWDLTSIFASDEAFLDALADARTLPDRYRDWQGTALASAASLLAYLRFDDDASVRLSRLANYAQRRLDEDTRSDVWQGRADQVTSCLTAVDEAQSWFVPAVIELDDATIEAFMRDERDLEAYARKIRKIRRLRPHVLPPREEALLASAGEVVAQPETVYSLFNDADLSFPDAIDAGGKAHPVTHGTFVPLMMARDRTLRQSAFESLYGTYRQFRNTSAAILASQVKVQKFMAEARAYRNEPGVPASMAASLFPTEVPTSVYLGLIDAVRANLAPLHRYVGLRRRLLGVDDLHFWDLYAPIVDKVDMTFTYERACEIMLEALAPLGEDYLAIVREGLSSRWVDVYENVGKRSGAYSAGGYGMHPVILMNFHGTLDDVFTLAHEMGHSVHTYLACSHQPPAYADYEMFVAEVASTCNEALLMRWFLDHARTDRERAYLITHYLEQFRTTLYRQCMFAEFERDVNELGARGEGITAARLCERYGALNRDYYGPDVVLDDGITLEWARIPHFFYDYYVYVYATSFAAATALSRGILEDGEQAVRRYLDFLSAGSSQPPIDLLRRAGVDMADEEPVRRALALFAQLVDELDELTTRLARA